MTITGGVEQRVNSTTTAFQGNGVVTVLDDGGWVVAWQSYGQDGSDHGIYQQRYDAYGMAIGGEVLVNTYTYLDQAAPVITSLADGGWVVTWQSYYQYYSNWSAYSQRFDADGDRVGSETSLAYSGSNADMAGLPDGGWIFAWDDTSYYVYANRYTSTGAATGATYPLGGGWLKEPDVAVLADGGWIVVATDIHEGDGDGVYLRRFDATGAAIGVNELVNTTTAGSQNAPVVTGLPDGGWLVAWKSQSQNGQGTDIYTQRYDSAGARQGGETLVNATTAGDQSAPTVAVLAGGGWVVAWQGNGNGDTSGIFQQVYSSSGVAIGSEILVNETASGDQISPSITAFEDGSWLVTWSGNGSGDDSGVFQRTFAREIDATGYDSTVSVSATGRALKPGDFQPDADVTSSIVITVLPTEGSLTLNGVPVTVGQQIVMADIRAGRLTYLPSSDPSAGLSLCFVVLDDGETYTGAEIANTLSFDHAPRVASTVATQSATEDLPFSFTIPGGLFSDSEGDILTYTATSSNGTALPAWLTFDAATGVFSGTPLDANVGTLSVKVTARDSNGGTAESTFDIAVANTYDAPVQTYSPTYGIYEDEVNYIYPGYYFQFDSSAYLASYSVTASDGSPVSWANISGTYMVVTPGNDQVGTQTLKLTVTDSLGGSGSGTVTFYVYNVNDAPTVANAIADQVATEDVAYNFQFAANAFADVDVGDVLTYSAQLSSGDALPSWLTFNAATRTFSGTPVNDDVGTLSIAVIARDVSGATAMDTFSLTVANTNDAPIVANAIPNQNATEDSAFNFQFATNVFADIDVGDTLTYSAELAGGGTLPSWLSFDAATRTFSGTPANGDVGTISIDVIASDGNGGTVTDTFDVVVVNANDAPYVANAITNQNATEDAAFNFQFAANVFADIDVGDTLTYSAELAGGGTLPSWLSFDAATRAFSGTPANGDVGTVSVDVIASDGNGGTVTETFDIVVANTNDAPTIATPIPDQVAQEGSAFNFQFSANTFADLDIGDMLAFSAQLAGGGGLPSWLVFDAATRTFSGTPANGDAGTIPIDVIATDGNGGTVTDTFNLVVSNAVHAPVVSGSISGQAILEDQVFAFQFGANVFADPDTGDVLSYSARLADGSGLPGWLHFDAISRTFSGTPGNDDTGLLLVEIIATDTTNLSIATQFEISIVPVNDAPTATGGTVAVGARSLHVFSASDFGFNDVDGDNFSAIVIRDLPTSGKLLFDGQPVASGREIDVEDISRLSWTPAANGGSDATFSFFVVDDGGTDNGGIDRSIQPATITLDVLNRVTGGAGRQMLRGTSGDDVLFGGRGNDKLTGGKGSDTFVFRTGDDRDVIRDFQAAGKNHDILDLSGLDSITGFKDLMKNHVDVIKGGIEIDAGNGDVIILRGVKLHQLDADDFLF